MGCVNCIHMSYSDIQAQVTLLPLVERIALTRYLTSIESEDELRSLLSQRMRSMDSGKGVTLEAFTKEHERLERERH